MLLYLDVCYLITVSIRKCLEDNDELIGKDVTRSVRVFI
jgi:hypothetical protein